MRPPSTTIPPGASPRIARGLRSHRAGGAWVMAAWQDTSRGDARAKAAREERRVLSSRNRPGLSQQFSTDTGAYFTLNAFLYEIATCKL